MLALAAPLLALLIVAHFSGCMRGGMAQRRGPGRCHSRCATWQTTSRTYVSAMSCHQHVVRPHLPFPCPPECLLIIPPAMKQNLQEHTFDKFESFSTSSRGKSFPSVCSFKWVACMQEIANHLQQEEQ